MAAPTSLSKSEQDVARDLALTTHPRALCLESKHSGGSPVLDRLVVGGGQCGPTVAFASKRSRVDNLLVVDLAPLGREGPWTTCARRRTLRSPTDQNGPDLGVPPPT